MTSSNRKKFHVTGPYAGNSPVTGRFPSQRPVMRSFDVFFDLRQNKRLSKHSKRRWFDTPSRSLWRLLKCEPFLAHNPCAPSIMTMSFCILMTLYPSTFQSRNHIFLLPDCLIFDDIYGVSYGLLLTITFIHHLAGMRTLLHHSDNITQQPLIRPRHI